MNRRRWAISLIVVGLMLALMQPAAVQASGVMIRPNLPADNLVPKAKGYFDFNLLPSQTRTVTITVANPTPTAQKVTVAMLVGVTPKNGQAEYLSAAAARQWQTRTATAPALQLPQVVTVPPGATTDVPITLLPATARQPGTHLLAVQLTTQPQAEGTVISHTRYLIGVVARGKPGPKKAPKLIRVTSRDGNPPQLMVTVARPATSFLAAAKVALDLTPATPFGVSYQHIWTARRLAPTSRGQWSLPLKGMKLAAGNYRLTWTATQGRQHEQARRFVNINAAGHIRFISAASFRRAQLRWVDWLISGLWVVCIVMMWRYVKRREYETLD